MSKWLRALSGGVMVAMLLCLCGFAGQCDDLRGRVLRVHVLAHSDKQEDQALKLKVRDTLTEKAAGMLDGAADEQQACALAAGGLDQLQKAAQQRVYDEGYTYPVRVELKHMYFTTRRYDTVTLPAGMYDALRVTIGDGAGKNWWCVAFPPMCVAAATEQQELDDVLNERQQEIVSNEQQFEVGFKSVELFEGLCNMVGEWFS